MRTLEGEVALVPGSGRGIGRKITFRLASKGAKAVVNDLDEGRVQEAILPTEIARAAATACVGRIARDYLAEHFATTAIDQFGDLAITVNNPGYPRHNFVQKMTAGQLKASVTEMLRQLS